MANLVFAYVRKQAAALLEVIRDRDLVGKMLVPSWFAYDLDALGRLFHALANVPATFQKCQFLLFRFEATTLPSLRKKPTDGSYLSGRSRFWGRRLREYRNGTKRNRRNNQSRNKAHEFESSEENKIAPLTSTRSNKGKHVLRANRERSQRAVTLLGSSRR